MRLSSSAYYWNEVMISRQQRSHKRDLSDSFYDYLKIEDRFRVLGFRFKNIQKSTFVENVGIPYFVCRQSDCTDTVIHSLKQLFYRYKAEAGTAHDSHYKSMINPNFQI